MSQKNEAIEYAEKESNRAAAKKYKVDVKRIREWRKSKESIKKLKNKHEGQGRQRLDGGGRKVTDEKLDEIILEWIHNRRANGLRVSRKLIMLRQNTCTMKDAKKVNKICLRQVMAGCRNLCAETGCH